MPRLENWSIQHNSKGSTLLGEIFDDEQKRFEDGTVVRTSRLQGEFNPESGQVQTLNTLYTLGEEARP